MPGLGYMLHCLALFSEAVAEDVEGCTDCCDRAVS